MFGAYFGRLQDFWFLEVASSLPKVVTAKSKFSCLEHILAFCCCDGQGSVINGSYLGHYSYDWSQANVVKMIGPF